MGRDGQVRRRVGPPGVRLGGGAADERPGVPIRLHRRPRSAGCRRIGSSCSPPSSGRPTGPSSTRPGATRRRGARGTTPPTWRRSSRATGRRGDFWSAHPELPKRPIREWQLWNEPDIRFYWDVPSDWTAAWPRGYLKLLKVTRSAIKSRDRKAKVVLAGLSDEPLAALAGSTRLKARRLFDVVAIHSYNAGLRDAMGGVRARPLGDAQGTRHPQADLDHRAGLARRQGQAQRPRWASAAGHDQSRDGRGGSARCTARSCDRGGTSATASAVSTGSRGLRATSPPPSPTASGTTPDSSRQVRSRSRQRPHSRRTGRAHAATRAVPRRSSAAAARAAPRSPRRSSARSGPS